MRAVRGHSVHALVVRSTIQQYGTVVEYGTW